MAVAHQLLCTNLPCVYLKVTRYCTVVYPPIQEELRIQRDISHSYLHLCILQCHFYFYAHPVLWRRVLIGWARNCNEWKSHLFALYDCWNFPLLPQMFCQTNLFDISPLCLFICTLTLFWYGALWLNWMSAELQLQRMKHNATMQWMITMQLCNGWTTTTAESSTASAAQSQ